MERLDHIFDKLARARALKAYVVPGSRSATARCSGSVASSERNGMNVGCEEVRPACSSWEARPVCSSYRS